MKDPTPTRSGEVGTSNIEKGYNSLQDALKLLELEVEQLVQKLGPVMRPVEPSAEPQEVPSANVVSSYASGIARFSSQAKKLSALLNSTNNRLDL